MKQKNQFVTEISEEDFRKLDLKGYRQVRKYEENKNVYYFDWEMVNLNDILDQNIQYLLSNGWESDLETLKCPVTVAVHKCNGPEPDDYFLDKFMNRFDGPKTYEFGYGIEHLYSTRDYFEAKEKDYWRVPKREVKSIYRVHLDKKYADFFRLKHKLVVEPWPYADKEAKPGAELHLHCELDEKNDKWIEVARYKVEKVEHGSFVTPIDENGNEILLEKVNK